MILPDSTSVNLFKLVVAALDASLDIIREAGTDRIRKKNIRQTEYLLYLTCKWLLPLGFAIASPEQSSGRGSHISLRHDEGYHICQALIDPEPPEKKVIPVFKRPRHNPARSGLVLYDLRRNLASSKRNSTDY